MKCRHCSTPLEHLFLDLGFAPPSNAYLVEDDLCKPERTYPLRIRICDQCWLAQTEDYASADEFFNADYAYFSSTSSAWLAHAKNYTDKMQAELKLNENSLVVEIASNDGYLLQNFVAAGIPCLGIEPTASTAEAAERKGIPVLRDFFGEALARQLADEGKQADLIAGNNVYAHVPDINDFTRGMQVCLKEGGTITLEFPHLLQLMEHTQFDTVYHEHFSYLSLYTVSRVFTAAGLRVFDVEELPTHGGSLRIYGCHAADARENRRTVAQVLEQEARYGLQTLTPYQEFQARADKIKNDLLVFLIKCKQEGRSVAAYGAAAKGNTLLNYAGVKPDLLPFICDAASAKQGKFTPGSHIPILPPDALQSRRPDYLLILPWNIADEVREQNAALQEAGTQFVTAVPELRIT